MRWAVLLLLWTLLGLFFLDVQMPELDGIALAQALDSDAPIAVVFVTAYDQYAVKAFELHAADYLLKPFDRDRFHRTLDHVRQVLRRENGDTRDQVVAALQQMRGGGYSDRFMVRTSDRIFFLKADEIVWVESAGNYVRLHGAFGSHLIRETMAAIDARLDPNRFVRIHRTAIVSFDAIREIQPLFHGECTVLLRDGAKLPLSRGYRARLEERFGK